MSPCSLQDGLLFTSLPLLLEGRRTNKTTHKWMKNFLVWIACYCVFCLNLLMHSRKELDFSTDMRPTNTSHQLANNKAYRSPSTLSIGTGCSFALSIKSTCLGVKPACKKVQIMLSIRFTIDVWQGTGFHKAITVPCITFLHLQHV